MDIPFHDILNAVPAKFGAAAALFSLLLCTRHAQAAPGHQLDVRQIAVSPVFRNAERPEMSGKRSDGDAETVSECLSRRDGATMRN
jgi:hypothetical protein